MIPNPPTMIVPLRTDANGAIRIGNTRVLLELVISAYQRGETSESIIDSYPSLSIGDVYAVLGYYWANRDAIDAYARQRDSQAEQALRDMESARTPAGVPSAHACGRFVNGRKPSNDPFCP
jgi:uncharacterized protein (DUF433 family)